MTQSKASGKTFETILKNEFVARKEANECYSLRAFARDLGIQASPLSAMMNGKRPISAKMKNKLGNALGLSAQQLQEIGPHKKGDPTYLQLDFKIFEALSKWHFYAIIELFSLKSFKHNISWMAKQLQLTGFQVRDALTTLAELGLAKKDNEGTLWPTPEGHFSSTYKTDTTDEARKRLQKEIINKSLHTIDAVAISQRDHSSMIFAIDEKDLPRAKEMAKKFRREMAQFFDRSADKNAVYGLHIGLFPLTKNTKE